MKFYWSHAVIVKLACKQTDVEMIVLTKKIESKVADLIANTKDEIIIDAEYEEHP